MGFFGLGLLVLVCSFLANFVSEGTLFPGLGTSAPLPAWGTEAKLYGEVLEEDLPWFDRPSPRLSELLESIEATRLVSAFRTTRPNPLGGEESNVKAGATYLAGTIVRPGELVSLDRALGPRTIARGFTYGPMYSGGRVGSTLGGGICQIATTLYNAVVLAGLKVVERHPHSMLVGYAPPGRDATIAAGAKDLRFRNPYDSPVLIWAEFWDKSLFIALYGQVDPPIVEWQHQELARKPTWVIEQPDASLAPGERKVIMEGYDGVTVRTWVTIWYPEEGLMDRIEVGTDYYRPLPGLVKYGPT